MVSKSVLDKKLRRNVSVSNQCNEMMEALADAFGVNVSQLLEMLVSEGGKRLVSEGTRANASEELRQKAEIFRGRMEAYVDKALQEERDRRLGF